MIQSVIILILFTVIFASLEPFLPGSTLLGWVVAVGAMRRDWRGLMTVVVAGVLRDTVMVSTLGVSSILFTAIWVASAFTLSRFEHPMIIVSVMSLSFSFVMGRVVGQGTTVGDIAVNAAIGLLSLSIWRMFQERRSGIRLRE